MISVSVPQTPITVIDNRVLISVGVLGMQGATGRGIPTGGTTGQFLAKASDANYDTVWISSPASNLVSPAIAGQTISALKLVYVDPETSKILYADKDTPSTAKSLLGIALQAGIVDDTINVLTSGVAEDSNWAWNMDGNINLFLGANGAIVQGAPVADILVKIGYAISPTRLMLRIGDSVLTN